MLVKYCVFVILLVSFQYVQCYKNIEYTRIIVDYYQKCYRPKPFTSMMTYMANMDPDPTWEFAKDKNGLAKYISNHYSELGLDQVNHGCLMDFYHRHRDFFDRNVLEDKSLEDPEMISLLHCAGKLAANFFENNISSEPADLVKCVDKNFSSPSV
ncbi:unnamed protein product [Acanthoscelides obtectus]|uniref:Uncharacterized protein n=1 Tax=Acanthoscelides obtectus TaxID=200917 RepID=A0A9P0K422_ACAOB|nr:unnamed protein product [Acanthoscelides obtectus]CAK1676668.1 hypothetical protein AOBTE_LOCUS30895 [Acanthoscelides obtectus]